MNKRFALFLAVMIALGAPALAATPTPPAGPAKATPPASAAPKDDGTWPMPAKNYASTRFADLDEINDKNVANLRAASTFSLGTDKGASCADRCR